MSTRAMDLATIIKAFITLKQWHQIGEKGWNASNSSQQEVFDLLEKYAGQVAPLNDLECEARIVSPMEIVVTAVLDKTVHWKEGVAKTAKVKNNNISYPAFRLEWGCRVYEAGGLSEPLLVVETKNGDKLWILMSDVERDGLELVRMALAVTQGEKKAHPKYVSDPEAIIPKIDFKLEPDIGFLVGASTTRNCDNWTVTKANQKFKFRMNEEGARVVVETSMMILGCCLREVTKKETIIINKPFIGWFTQASSCFPMAVFYADCDSWKESGKLKEL